MKKALAATALILILGLIPVSPAIATSSERFFERGGEVYDSFGISRTRSTGEDGFLQLTESGFNPIIGREIGRAHV